MSRRFAQINPNQKINHTMKAISIDDAEDGDSFEVPAAPVSAPQPEIQIVKPVQAEQFPGDLGAAFELLKQIDAEICSLPDGPARRSVEKRHELLRAHIHRIQQGPQPSATAIIDHLPAARAWANEAASNELLLALADAGDTNAKVRLDSLRAASVRPATSRPARKPGNSFRDRIAGNADVQKSLSEAIKARVEFAKAFDRVSETLLFEEHAKACEAALGTTADLTEINALRARLQKLRGPGANEARLASQKMIARAFEPFRTALSALLRAAKTQLHDLESEVEVAETALGAGFGLPRQHTALANHLSVITATLSGFDSILTAQDQRPHGLNPSLADTILDWFTL